MKYIANFDIPENIRQQRSVNLAAVNVMSYISELINDVDQIEIISPSRTLSKRGVYKATKIKLSNGILLRLPLTIGVSSRIGRIISILLVQIWLLWILLFECKHNETVLVYHSVSLMPIIKFTQRLKRFNLIFEIRELYSDINTNVSKKRELEYFRIAHKYIFATNQLNDQINSAGKPFIIAPGIYRNEICSDVKKWDDGKTHLVYAGNFRRAKGGAIASIKIAEHLTPDYTIHILGSGDEASLKEVLCLIEEQNSKGHAKVIYEGVLRGKEFNTFLQKCDIGLSTQNPEGEFNGSSFPSKVLTYMANGLEVVSADIPAVTNSPVGRYIHYYHLATPSSIADTILAVNSKKNSIDLLTKLDSMLRNELKTFLKI